jgi:hypothetical protein
MFCIFSLYMLCSKLGTMRILGPNKQESKCENLLFTKSVYVQYPHLLYNCAFA